MTEEEFKGIFGESLTERLIDEYLGVYKRIIRDCNIEIGGKSTQIDNILITTKGIYVIENKNFNGLLVVNENNEWIQCLGDNKYYLTYNPYYQNKYHIEFLIKKIGLESKYFNSLIVLGYNVKKNIKINYEDCVVLNIQELIQYIIDDFLNKEDILTHEQIDNIYMLLKYNN